MAKIEVKNSEFLKCPVEGCTAEVLRQCYTGQVETEEPIGKCQAKIKKIRYENCIHSKV
jgi:hypothetical protein